MVFAYLYPNFRTLCLISGIFKSFLALVAR